MSDPVVVNVFRDRLQMLGGSPTTVPYVDTLNTRPPKLPDLFVGLERDFSSVQRITLGTPTQFRETGTLFVVISVRAGTGIDVAQTLCEEARDLFHNYAVEQFRVTVVDSATPIDPDEGNFFQLKFPVQYTYDFFK